MSTKNQTNFLVSQNEQIAFVSSKTSLISKSRDFLQRFQILSEISKERKALYQITNPFLSPTLRRIIHNREQMTRTWIVSPKKEERVVREGDIIKLGRIRLKISKINFRSTNSYSRNINSIFNLQSCPTHQYNYTSCNIVNNDQSNSNFQGIVTLTNNSIADQFDDMKNGLCQNEKWEEGTCCRICYRSESDLSDPLITPCKCSGSMAFIHYSCLKKSIDSRTQKTFEQGLKIFIWRDFECEICKEKYPQYLRYKNHFYSLIDMNIDFNEYVQCDYSLFDDTTKRTFRKGLIVFSIQEGEEISLGRTQSNKIKLKDISVSRNHCLIFRKKNNLYFKDKGSKFGTMIYLQQKLYLGLNSNEYQNIGLSTGKYFLSFTINKNWGWCLSLFNMTCCHGKNTNDKEFLLEEVNKILRNEEKNKEDRESESSFEDSYEDYILDLELECLPMKLSLKE